jgi:hypothetical protein
MSHANMEPKEVVVIVGALFTVGPVYAGLWNLGVHPLVVGYGLAFAAIGVAVAWKLRKERRARELERERERSAKPPVGRSIGRFRP